MISKPELRKQIATLASTRLKDTSTNPLYWNRWELEWEGGKIFIFLQRWCNGRRRGIINYVDVRRDGVMLKVRELEQLIEHLKA